jgi:hypothetical protein
MQIRVKNPHEGLINRWAAMWLQGYLVAFTLARDRQGTWMTVTPHPSIATEAPPIISLWLEELQKGAIVHGQEARPAT